MKKPTTRHHSRVLAMQALFQWHFTQETPAQLLQEFLAEHATDEKTIAYCRTLFLETIEAVEGIDKKLSQHIPRKLSSVNPIELAILRLAVNELDHHPEVPPKVVINEAIELAKTYGASDGYKFVNGVLDALRRAC